MLLKLGFLNYKYHLIGLIKKKNTNTLYHKENLSFKIWQRRQSVDKLFRSWLSPLTDMKLVHQRMFFNTSITLSLLSFRLDFPTELPLLPLLKAAFLL